MGTGSSPMELRQMNGKLEGLHQMEEQAVKQEQKQEDSGYNQNYPHIDFNKMCLLNRFFCAVRVSGFVRISFFIKCKFL